MKKRYEITCNIDESIEITPKAVYHLIEECMLVAETDPSSKDFLPRSGGLIFDMVKEKEGDGYEVVASILSEDQQYVISHGAMTLDQDDLDKMEGDILHDVHN